MNIRRKGLGALCRRVPFYAVLLLLTTVCIIPLYWMIRASFMKNTQIYVLDPFVFFPWPISFKYYQQVFDYIPVVRYALNTIVYVTGCVIGTVLTSAMAAYAFSRIKWKGRDVCFFIILTSMMHTIPAFFDMAFFESIAKPRRSTESPGTSVPDEASRCMASLEARLEISFQNEV